MRDFLARRWFLVLLALGLGLAWFRPGWLRPMTERVPLRGAVALALFLTAWSLESRSLLQALLRPAPALWALAVSYGALPALAWGVGSLLPLADQRVGLLIMGSVPCTLASAVLWTRLGGGNEALALLIIVLSTATSWLATTPWLTLATGVAVRPNTADLMANLALVLIVPVALGQCARALPGVAAALTRHKALNSGMGRLLILAILLKAAVDLTGHFAHLTLGVVLTTAGACVVVHLSALALGLWGGRALGFPRADCIAIAFGGSQKTLPVALFLFGAYYQNDYPLAVVALVLYHVGQLVLDTFVADALRTPSRHPARDS
jgi:sodium/bile acid cotransporter 7